MNTHARSMPWWGMVLLWSSDAMRRATASAPSKVILFGEHAVVYGRGAIVAAIDRRTSVEIVPSENIIIHAPLKQKRMKFSPRGEELIARKESKEYAYVKTALQNVFRRYGSSQGMEVSIENEAPVGAGLGSSASVVVATIAASQAFLDMNLSREEISEIAHETEREVQGASSGIDPTVATHGGMLFYRNGTFERLPLRRLPLAIGYTGKKGSTMDLVAGVRNLHEKYPHITTLLFDAIDSISGEAKKNLSGEPDMKRLGELMNMNHGILQSLGVSSVKLERLVTACRRAGAYGAKLTGAGGGGCMVALGRNLEDAIRKAGGIPIKARMTEEGVKVRAF